RSPGGPARSRRTHRAPGGIRSTRRDHRRPGRPGRDRTRWQGGGRSRRRPPGRGTPGARPRGAVRAGPRWPAGATRSAEQAGDDPLIALEGGALHVEREPPVAAELLATTGPTGAAVQEVRHHGTRAGRLGRHLLAAEVDPSV